MAYSLEDKLVVGITSRALFNLEDAHRIYEQEGLDAYRIHQLRNEQVLLKPGTAFSLVRGLLGINESAGERLVEVVLISRNDADSGLRIFNSIEEARLDVSRAAFTDGRSPYEYLQAFKCDLFLSANDADVRGALKEGFAAALVYELPQGPEATSDEIRIAFDGDAVLFSDESEQVYQKSGLEAFQNHEVERADELLNPGPFKGFLVALSRIQGKFRGRKCPVRTALVTARGAPAAKRPIKTLRAWDVRVDQSFFLGGVEKRSVLEVFRPHIFFDDQRVHLDPVAGLMAAAQVLSSEPSQPRQEASTKQGTENPGK